MANIHIRAPLCIAAGAVLPPVCSGMVAMRFYARRQQNHRYQADDWLTLPALVLVIGMSAALLTGVSRKSVGYPTPPIEPGKTLVTTSSYEQTTTRSIYWAIELMQIPALTFVKMSFVFFYRRIFNTGGDRLFGRTTIAALGIIAVWGVSYFFSFLFICPGHPTAYWTTLVEEKKRCINTVVLHNAYGVSDVVVDFIVILLPIPVIWRLKLSTGRKLAIVGIFGLGAFSIVASIFRMVTYLQSTAVEFLKGTDTDILITGGIYWSVVETGVGLISACLPTAYGVFRTRVGTKMRSTKNLSSLKSDPRESRFHHSATRGKIDRHLNDSQASDIELAVPREGHNTAKASAELDTWGPGPRDRILITQTFEASDEPSRGATA